MSDSFKRTAFDLPKDIDLVAGQIFHVSQEVLQSIEKRVELTAPNHADREYVLNVFFEYLDRYCAKTGVFLGEVDLDETAKLFKLQGHEKTEIALRAQASQNISPAWLFTDSATLDAQMVNDPLGYFIFAAGELLWEQFAARLPKSTHNATGKLVASQVTKWFFVKQKALLHARLSRKLITGEISWQTIHETNEVIRRFLALFAPSRCAHIVKWTNTPFSELTPEAIVKDCRYNIAEILKHELRNKRLRRRVSYDNIIAITELYEGKKQFRTQKKPTKMSVTEHAELLLQDVMRETLAGNSGVREEVVRQSWRAEAVEQREAMKNRKRTYNGTAVSNITFSGFKFKSKE